MSLEGTRLGNYQLVRLIGGGGMGEVYLAEDTRIQRQVAIKVIREEVAPYPDASTINEAARLFQREMKAISQLDHPYILPLFDFGEATLNRARLTYMVMPFRHEGSLADWLQQRSSGQMLSPQQVAHFVSQAADALQYAHEHQLIHQDVKPSNFLIRSRSGHLSQPDLLLSDFGIAKFTTATATVSQSIRGTPAYMAPEQWDGQPVAATDQYALAVMAYQLLTGRPLFLGGPAQVMRQHFQVQPQPPSTFNGSLSPAIDAVLIRALAKDPVKRFPSVSAFAGAFQEAVQSDGALQATLAISQAEAESGTTRSLTLPGGRQLSVSVPAGVKNGSILNLEGQGMPYYEGGPSGPLVLMIAISEEVSSQPLSQASTDPTVAVSMPNVELLTVEDSSVSPAHPEAPSELEPTVLASYVSEPASTVLAIGATSLPTEVAKQSSQKAAADLSRTKDGTSWKDWIITTLAGIAIFGVASYITDFAVLNIPSNSPLWNPIIPAWYSQSWLALIVGWSLVVPFFFGARFGPWIGLCTAVIGGLLGDIISGYLTAFSIGWYWYVAIAACGFFPGLAYRLSRGRNLSIRAALLFSLLGMSVYFIIGTIGYSISNSQWIWGSVSQYAIPYLFQMIITSMLASLPALLLLFIALSISNALGKNHIPS